MLLEVRRQRSSALDLVAELTRPAVVALLAVVKSSAGRIVEISSLLIILVLILEVAALQVLLRACAGCLHLLAQHFIDIDIPLRDRLLVLVCVGPSRH